MLKLVVEHAHKKLGIPIIREGGAGIALSLYAMFTRLLEVRKWIKLK